MSKNSVIVNGKEITVFWDIRLCGPLDTYQRFGKLVFGKLNF
jgi:hypothetical protein